MNIIDIHSNSHPSISKSLDHQYGCETHTGTEVLVELETKNFNTAIQPYAHTSIPQAMKGEYTDGEPIISEQQTSYTNTPYHVNETYSEGGGGGEGGAMRAHNSEIEEREDEDPTKSSAPQKQAGERQGKDIYHILLII